MTGLEIALFVLGAAFIVISFFIIDSSEGGSKSPSENDVSRETIRRISADAIEDINRKSDTIVAESEDRLEAISNDKIIAVGEYSDQVIEKISNNHKEVVFLYQMLTDKEEELKSTALKLDNIRIECEKLIKSEVALEAQRSNDNAAALTRPYTRMPEPERIPDDPVAESLKRVLKEVEAASEKAELEENGVSAGEHVTVEPEIAAEPERVEKQTEEQLEEQLRKLTQKQPQGQPQGQRKEQRQGQPREMNNKPAAVLDPKEKAMEEARKRARAAARERAKTVQAQAMPTPAASQSATGQPVVEKRVKKQTAPVEAEGRDNRSLSRNEEIIDLHKQGKTVMEISKLLGMGQGAVQLIINLYG